MRNPLKSFVFCCFLIGGLFVATIISVVIYHFGSFEVALAYFKGRSFLVSPQIVDLGTCELSTEKIATVKIVNLMDHSISIIGCEQDCSCITLDKLPISLNPQDSYILSLKVKMPSSGNTSISRNLVLYIDDNDLNIVPLVILAKILPQKKGDEKRFFN